MKDPQKKLIERAVWWALAHTGSKDYAFKCYTFVEDAYELGGRIRLDGKGTTAKEAADAYGARENTGTPPRGAYVCYECTGTIDGEEKDWGHIGLSLGRGQVIHAWNVVRADDYQEIEDLSAPGWTNPKYIGWVPVDQILEGMKPKGTGE